MADLLSLAFGAVGRALLKGHGPLCECPDCQEIAGHAGRVAGLVRGAAAVEAAGGQLGPTAAPVVPVEVVAPAPPRPKVIEAQVVEVRPVGAAPKKGRTRKPAPAAPRQLGDGARAPSPVGRKR